VEVVDSEEEGCADVSGGAACSGDVGASSAGPAAGQVAPPGQDDDDSVDSDMSESKRQSKGVPSWKADRVPLITEPLPKPQDLGRFRLESSAPVSVDAQEMLVKALRAKAKAKGKAKAKAKSASARPLPPKFCVLVWVYLSRD
jgi:hypothetical protein